MIRLFKHYVPHTVLFLGAVDFLLLMLAGEAGWSLRAWQIGSDADFDPALLPHLLVFAATLQTAMVGVGAYGVDALRSMRIAAARLVVAVSLGVLLLSLIFFLLPTVGFWRSNLLYAMLLALAALFAARLVFERTLGSEAFRRRVLVLGAGHRAARLEALAKRDGAGFAIVGYVGMNDGAVAVAGAVNRADIPDLTRHVVRLGASEVVLALEERRNALPLADLLRIKTTGVHVNEISSFLERETGRVDLDSLNPSWLIFSDGFSSGRRLSAAGKRLFDILVSATILLLFAPLIGLTALLVKLESEGPAFFRQRRVGLYGQGFEILKLRSMRQDAEVGGKAVWAQKDDPRVTRVGAVIRKLRIDELPQAWTVLKGEMSLVGPRPERPQFVADLESRLPYYSERHVVKPGITGWAQINFPYGASVEDARQKLEYDLYYAKNYTPFLDLLILLQTVRVVLWPEGAR
ncbi:MAG: TIGR03013 family PEP-CTERM/XrtA system glycosyltransferase [Alphaproteobacteria bacterium]|nr:TIGR03013 family PEP-CTERM/XrtA system glycosyltransferase [Alphaproteobacteria bacterium]MBV9372040.1 TIGR03013 family PEP-CTERM/XrtA system glycosyltransferase [Alphaproteobacteria bacterium]MBV9902650.1 TIGR03013 family PEP-CTERM/XrtA system glycosyltransferase [Alphaproteobacteria bacterium]